MEWDFGKHQSRKWKQGGRKYWTKKFLPKTLLVQVAFFVKHEVVGGQVEVLARTTFQIPDLVAACRWAQHELLDKICTPWPIQNTLNGTQMLKISGKATMVTFWNVVFTKVWSLRECFMSISSLRKRWFLNCSFPINDLYQTIRW